VEPTSEQPIQQLVKEARELIQMLEKTSVQRVSLEAGDFKIQVERVLSQGPAPVGPPAAPGVLAPGPAGPAPAPTKDPHHRVLAPLVGTFYRAPNPGAKPFVEIGTRVQRNQTIGIIEAMKIMNEVTSDAAGVVVEILIENGQPVQYEQPLLVIDTTT
jgi:acetyl-CoA carboxylase biotin carboxyl carrier protein